MTGIQASTGAFPPRHQSLMFGFANIVYAGVGRTQGFEVRLCRLPETVELCRITRNGECPAAESVAFEHKLFFKQYVGTLGLQQICHQIALAGLQRHSFEWIPAPFHGSRGLFHHLKLRDGGILHHSRLHLGDVRRLFDGGAGTQGCQRQHADE